MIDKCTPCSYNLPSSIIIPIKYQQEGVKNPDDITPDGPWYLSDDDEGGAYSIILDLLNFPHNAVAT